MYFFKKDIIHHLSSSRLARKERLVREGHRTLVTFCYNESPPGDPRDRELVCQKER